jgi:predicted dienelactone hydrolase
MVMTRRMSLLSVATGVGLAILASGCADKNDASGTDSSISELTTALTMTSVSETAPTTTDSLPAIRDLSARGPHPVGVTTRELPDGALVEIWYPAATGSGGDDEYDLRDFTPDFLAPLLVNVTTATFGYQAGRDTPVEAEADPFPLAVFSHGFGGMRMQSTFLTTHLASHGIIVISADHSSRDLRNVLGGTASGNQGEAVAQLRALIDLAGILNVTEPAFTNRIDMARIALVGHSAGGASVQGAASDPRVSGYIALAAGGPPEGFEIPQVPGFFIAGSTDGVISPTERTRPAHLVAATPSWYLEIAQTGHNAFDDFCLLGGGTGIVGVAEEAGLGAILEAQPSLRLLGEDGCLPPAAPVELAHPLITHAVTVWLQWLFGVHDDLGGLDTEGLDRFALGSVISERK